MEEKSYIAMERLKPSGNNYTVVNLLQGKYEVDNGQVGHLDLGVNGMPIVDFEKKIN